jgi:hypothetical protein
MSFGDLTDYVASLEGQADADAERWQQHDMDTCMLCGASGPDKRSLFISCFYAISEVVPEAINLRKVPDPDFSGRGYYLRICKACRGSLLGHLAMWRHERLSLRGTPMDDDGNAEPESGQAVFYIRQHGATIAVPVPSEQDPLTPGWVNPEEP